MNSNGREGLLQGHFWITKVGLYSSEIKSAKRAEKFDIYMTYDGTMTLYALEQRI